jgi:uncharacterized membrane protein (DUF106 family)
MNEYLDRVIYTLIAAVVSGGVWIIRTVTTNNKKVELLQEELKRREITRQEDKKDVEELKSEIKELRNDIKYIFRNQK